MSLSTGAIVDRYAIEGKLGSGGMATVYRVRHTELGSLHAMKLLHVTSPAVKQRLRREGQLQASLRHPNIVTVTDIVMLDGDPGLVMEYVDGPTLEQFLTMHRPNHAQLDALVEGMIRGVAAAHAMGMVHRDLKPANILLARGPQGPIPKIADFGLAKALGETDGGGSLTRSGQAMGTPYYMAPEQAIDAKNVGAKVDVWALGAILYEMATGRRAFEGEHLPSIFHRVMQASFDPLQTAAPDLPPRMRAAIEGALKAEADERIPDCETLLQTWFSGVPSAQGSGPWGSKVLQGLDQHAASHRSMPHNDNSGTFDPAALDDPTDSLLTEDHAQSAQPTQRKWYLLPLMGMAGTGVLVMVFALGVLLTQQVNSYAEQAPVAPVDTVVNVQPEPVVQTVSPETVAPTPVAPTPVEPAPAPRVQPDAAPVPRSIVPPPEPAAVEPHQAPGPTSQHGTVRVSGEALAVQLVSATGTYDPGTVPPDSYTVRATFPGSASVVDAGSVTVSAGQTVRLVCDGGFLACHAQ